MQELDKNENYNKTFEDIKHINENGIEFWYARELGNILLTSVSCQDVLIMQILRLKITN